MTTEEQLAAIRWNVAKALKARGHENAHDIAARCGPAQLAKIVAGIARKQAIESDEENEYSYPPRKGE